MREDKEEESRIKDLEGEVKICRAEAKQKLKKQQSIA